MTGTKSFSTRRRTLYTLLPAIALALAPVLGACGEGDARHTPDSPVTIVFKHGKLFGDPQEFDSLIARFEAANPGVRVRSETLPAASDAQHQFYVINLRAGSADFDVLALDVIWVAEFARAGWLADLSGLVTPQDRRAFFAGPLAAVTYRGRLYAAPWFVDAGLLYYRSDLLARYGYAPPATWEALARAASDIAHREPRMFGFVWQGKQYEGLVCNALEYLWSAGGDVLEGDQVVIDSAANRHALGFMHALVHGSGVSPALVTTATEETARRIFGSGRAVFMRNWPYAWTLLERPGSPVRGKVGISVLPHFPGHASAATLGGWQLGVNRHSRHPQAAAQFVRFMTSRAAQKALALAYGLNPSRRGLYDDPELRAAQPHLAQLRGIFERARPRPVTPRYVRISQVLQSAFSAAVAGIETPGRALATAQRRIEAVLARR